MKRKLFVDENGEFCLVEHGEDISIKISGRESFDINEEDAALISESIKKADKLYDKEKKTFVPKAEEVLPKKKETDTMNPDNTKQK